LTPEDLALCRAVLAQKTPLTFPFQVGEVVALGRLAHRRHSDATLDARAVAQSLSQVDLKDFETRRYTTLSGGEQQRTQLARILAQVYCENDEEARRRKPILFLDEPISALDIRHQCRILGTARQLANQGHAVFAVLHDLNYALRFADRLILMREGKIAHDVASAHCHPTILEEVFSVSLNRISDPSCTERDFYFPNHPKPEQE
jgi:iron complex transport system ATP-binding protein